VVWNGVAQASASNRKKLVPDVVRLGLPLEFRVLVHARGQQGEVSDAFPDVDRVGNIPWHSEEPSTRKSKRCSSLESESVGILFHVARTYTECVGRPGSQERKDAE
jgi:hypothetical protein